jgi:riboflavin transporter FmnP
MNQSPTPPQSNLLGAASLVLGVLASSCVVSVGLCAGVGQQQGWLGKAGGALLIVGGTAAFVGAVSALLGLGGLFGRNRSRAAALFGLILGVVAAVLFLAIVNASPR